MKPYAAAIEKTVFTTGKLTAYQPACNTDELILLTVLKENVQYDNQFKSSLAAELKRFLQFSSSMLAAFPVGLLMRQYIRKNKRLHYILQFEALLPVRNNIEKGSFAYDTLLFKQSPLQLLQNKSHLANLLCLAILFGDEFIDGIAAELGKQPVQHILGNEKLNYYLHTKKENGGNKLYYQFDICKVLPETVLTKVNRKYGITYRAFYEHLQFLLQEMNNQLTQLEEEKSAEVSKLICKACNKCFDTYKADINEFTQVYSFADLLQYQKTKDDDIIQVLLTLRAVLLNKKQLQFQKDFGSWSSMVRSMQLYDDMQDAAADCDFQMNTVCYFAKHYFFSEWQWLQKNKLWLQKQRGLYLHSSISVHMPASCMMVMQYARNIANAKLSWVQRKIQNYLWRKNWLGFSHPIPGEKEFCLSSIMNKNEKSISLKLGFIQRKILQVDALFISENMKWAHIIDVVLMDKELKTFLFKKISGKEKYFLTNCFIEYPVAQKAALAKKVFPV